MFIELNELERDGRVILIRTDHIETIEPRPDSHCAIRVNGSYILVTESYKQVRGLLWRNRDDIVQAR